MEVYATVWPSRFFFSHVGGVMGGKRKEFQGIFIGRHKADLFLKLEFAV
jgi:hypothetical protein